MPERKVIMPPLLLLLSTQLKSQADLYERRLRTRVVRSRQTNPVECFLSFFLVSRFPPSLFSYGSASLRWKQFLLSLPPFPLSLSLFSLKRQRSKRTSLPPLFFSLFLDPFTLLLPFPPPRLLLICSSIIII